MLNNLTQGPFLPHSPISNNGLNRYDSTSVRCDSYDLPGVFKWWSCDTEERYKNNLDLQPQDWHYRTKEVTYNVNSAGYRCPEWDQIDWANSIVIFGCSETFGTGLAEDETISASLSKLTGINVVNMGKNGTSMMFALANNLILRNHFPKPLAVINHWTESSRETYFGLDKIVQVLPRHEIYYKKHYSMLVSLANMTIDDVGHHYDFMGRMISDLAKAIWDDTNYIESTWNWKTALLTNCHKITQVDQARDVVFEQNKFIGHSGRETGKILAEYYAEKLKL